MNLNKLTQKLLVIVATVGASLSLTAKAQQMPPPLPADTMVRVGVLDNGLTYFIRKNTLPQKRADFYIAQRVGSMQEEENQKGLAHFLEHIAFNGTKHFPGKTMINWLETLGASFGSNINAYTGFDETVYTLKDIPVERTSIVDSCLLILHDWSSAISLEDKEIDAERGVIQEEWRSRDNGNMRVMERALSDLFPGHKYGARIPIGSMEVVRNFKYKELRDYYKKWYRPDLQALIIVGDIDVDYVEKTIKAQFRDVPKPVNAAVREYLPVADHTGVIASIQTDPEKTGTQVGVSFKTDVLPREAKATIVGLQLSYIYSVVGSMIDERFAEITKKPNAPFLSATGGLMPYGYIAYTKDALSFSAMTADGKALEGLKALTAEIERLRQYGFTEGEYKRASKNFMAGLKKGYNERDKRKNNDFTTLYVDYFTKGGTLADLETQYTLYEQIAQHLPLQVINEMLAQIIRQDNISLMLQGPKKPEYKYPTPDELTQLFIDARNQPVEAYKEAVSDEQLMNTLPKAGKVIKEERNAMYGSTIWTLSNGVQVIFKPTKHKEDQVLMTATRPGGIYALPKASTVELRMMGEVNALGGLGAFDETALAKVLTGRVVDVNASVGTTSDNISGNSSKDDLETMLQLVYLNFTAPRLDQEAYEAYKQKRLNMIATMKSNPMASIGDSISHVLYPDKKLYQSLTEEEVRNANYARIMELYKSRMTNAKDFKFYFVGNIEEERLRPLVERYLASLPVNKKLSTKSTESLPPRPRRGNYTNHYSKAMTTPMGLVVNILSGKLDFTQSDNIKLRIASAVLDQIYTKTIREEEGGTYGAQTTGSIQRVPQGEASLQIVYQTDPAKIEHLNAIVYKELEKLVKDGIETEYFDKTVANMQKAHKVRLEENSYWLTQLANYYTYGDDYVTHYEKILASITKEDVRALVQQLLDQKNKAIIILSPSK